jgi:hypothetical protein
MIAIFPNGDARDVSRRAACCAIEILNDPTFAKHLPERYIVTENKEAGVK